MSKDPTTTPMPRALTTLLGEIKTGPAVVCRNLVLVPLITPSRTELVYLHLADAIGRDGFKVTEVTEGGSVPNLMLVNGLDHFVLLFDGEELRGAKQNRTLNTTLLIGAHSETKIPVSCVEQGRWRYESAEFAASHCISPSSLRRKKSHSVMCSLAAGAKHTSDQGEVWDDVADTLHAMKVESATAAVEDAYVAAEQELRQFVASLPQVPGQTGFVALIDGEVAGCDLLCRPESFTHFRDQLVRSYGMEALISGKNGELARLENQLQDLLYQDTRLTRKIQGEDVLLKEQKEQIARIRSMIAGLRWSSEAEYSAGRFLATLDAEIDHSRKRIAELRDILESLHKEIAACQEAIARLKKQETARDAGNTAPDPAACAAAARAFLQRSTSASTTLHPTPGTGTDCRLAADDFHGAALMVDDTVVHFSLFPTRASESRRRWRSQFS